MNRWVRYVGYGLVGLILAGAFGVALLAALAGEPWLWRNYWNASVATSGILITFGAVGVLLAIKGVLVAWRWWRARRAPLR